MTNQRLSQAGDVRVTQNGTDVRIHDAISDYVVQYRTTAGPGAWITFADPVTGTTGATVTGLTNGVSYDFRVAAVSGLGRGQWSNIYTALIGNFLAPEIVLTTITATTTVVDARRSAEALDTTIAATTTLTDVARLKETLDTSISGTTDLVQASGFKATIATSWGTWSATSTGSLLTIVSGTISTNWGTVTKTAVASLSKPATVATNWGTWTATGIAVPSHPATIATSWGSVTATGVATFAHPATITTTWSWTATATATVNKPAAIATSWGTWSATSTATTIALISGTISSNWSSGAAPAAPVAGFNGRYVASELGLGDGDPLTDWPDLSGNGRHLAPASTPKPTYVMNALNGLGVVRFSGTTSEYLIAPSTGDYYHLFVVAKYAAATFDNYDGLVSSTGDIIWIGNSGATTFYPFGQTEFRKNGVVDSTGPMAAWAHLSVRKDAGYLAQQLVIGIDRTISDRIWNGDVAEVITYDHVLSDAERIHNESFFNGKYFGAGGTGWVATATATVETFVTHSGTIASNWGGWVATSSALADHKATVATSWGTVVATASATFAHSAAIATSWGTWTATGVAFFAHPATIATSWGTWTGTSTTVVSRYPTITTTWSTWTGTASGALDHPASVVTTWATWTATALGVAASFLPPANVVATATSKYTITVTWDASPTAVAYDIERNSTIIAMDHPASPYNDSGLTSGTLYSYRVRAVK